MMMHDASTGRGSRALALVLTRLLGQFPLFRWGTTFGGLTNAIIYFGHPLSETRILSHRITCRSSDEGSSRDGMQWVV